jgi:hypothetical protein
MGMCVIHVPVSSVYDIVIASMMARFAWYTYFKLNKVHPET